MTDRPSNHRDIGQSGTTLRTLRRMARESHPFACLTCYDASTARWLEQAGVHVLLVGDTAAEIVLGFDSTVHMPLEVSLALTAGVKRGAPKTVVMGDMPFMSYHAHEADAVLNAGRFITEGLADIVKIEADASFAPLVSKMSRAGIPVCGHVGSKPQHAGKSGGYASTGKTASSAERIVHDAIELERAGAVLLLVEAVPPEVAEAILERTTVPLIGIGAGPSCHGQILVLHDLLGITTWQPNFAPPVASMGEEIKKYAGEWIEKVARREVTDHRYKMNVGESNRFKS